MKRSVLLRYLQAQGCALVREGSRHSWWRNRSGDRRFFKRVCVAGDRAPAVENLGDAVHRYLEAPRKLRRAHAECVEILAQRLARVDRFAHDDHDASVPAAIAPCPP